MVLCPRNHENIENATQSKKCDQHRIAHSDSSSVSKRSSIRRLENLCCDCCCASENKVFLHSDAGKTSLYCAIAHFFAAFSLEIAFNCFAVFFLHTFGREICCCRAFARAPTDECIYPARGERKNFSHLELIEIEIHPL
jgi:hypothetical protein